MSERPSNIALFVTCLVDLFRPNVGFAAVKVMESVGASVVVPRAQTCCGQPAYNSGDRADARRVARHVIKTFRDFDYVVVPSGSCAGMITKHYPELFEDDAKWRALAEDLAERTHEYLTFLVDVLGVYQFATHYNGVCTYHDSCASLREMRVKETPRELLNRIGGIELRELETAEACCGFGGTFCVKYPEISNQMVEDKVRDIVGTGADTVVSADMGCLLNIAGKLRRAGHSTKVFHIAEILAGMTNGPGIGGPPDPPKSRERGGELGA